MNFSLSPPCARSRPLRSPWRRYLVFAFMMVLTPLGAFPAQFTRTTDPVLEYRVKAAFLYNFLKFTEWPAAALPPTQPIRLGVLGSPAIHTAIAESLKDKTVGEHRVEVVDLAADADPASCHLVFLPRAAAIPLADVTRRLAGKPVLLVGETDDFALSGGMIGFVLRGENVRFQVNLPATQKAGLKLSSRLAALAELVKTPTP